MLLLFTYVLIALVFSFLCSVAEAVLLSVREAYIAILEQEGRSTGTLWRKLKTDVNKPLSAILTLNTIAHTIGAAGAGAQAATVFGDVWLGVASAVLTLLILVFSEIIPKTLGATYWQQLAPATAHGLRILIWVLYPFVIMAELLTRGMSHGSTKTGLSREEFAVMAEVSAKEGHIGEQESEIVKNLLLLKTLDVSSAMTPRTVMFKLPKTSSVQTYFDEHSEQPFSRIPLYDSESDIISGFVLRSDLLMAQAKGNHDHQLEQYRRELPSLPNTLPLPKAFEQFLTHHTHMALVINEYGSTLGLITLEDVLETVLGLEIVDEQDQAADMQLLARRLWEKRAKAMGLDVGEG